jgi:peptidoglycan hydrolase-like protein with peptidoglycan-binding domain
MRNLVSFLGATLLATILFATVSAQVNVTAVGATTSSVTQVNLGAVNAVCPNLINNFHKIGDQGEEVAKLQVFLNQVNGAKLNGKGYFGPATQNEVKNFQFTYGIKPTGYQHILTTKAINDINCGKLPTRERKVFMAKRVVYAPVSTQVNYYPVASAPVNTYENIVKEYPAPKNIKLTGSTTKEISTSTKSSLWENLQKDWHKIKENYKAYLLVFVLVLALFWFLRKAATE